MSVHGQMHIPGLSLKVRGKGKSGPALSTFKLPALASTRFELDVDTEIHIAVTGPDGETLAGYYLRCDGVGFKKHRPLHGPPWIEREHKLCLLDTAEASAAA